MPYKIPKRIVHLLELKCSKKLPYPQKKTNIRSNIPPGLHAVVNNAGITGKHIADDFLDINEYLKVANINLWGPIRTTMAVKKLLKKAR